MLKRQILGTIDLTNLTALPALAQNVSFSTGPATTVINKGLIDCGLGSRVCAVGEIISDDDTTRTVPTVTHFLTGPKTPDRYNPCGGI